MENNNEIMLNSEEAVYQGISKKLWNPKGFVAISILFSFLPAAILYSLNYGRIGLKKKRNISLAISLGSFIILIVAQFFINQGLMKGVFYGVNIGAASYMASTQSKMFKDHIANGGRKASYIIPVVISIVFAAVIIGLMIFANSIPAQSLTYKGSDLYYTDNIEKKEVQRLGNYLEEQGFFTETNKVSVKIDKQSDTYKFSIIVDDAHVKDKEFETSISDLADELSQNIFNDSNVDILLCNNVFKPLKTVPNKNFRSAGSKI